MGDLENFPFFFDEINSYCLFITSKYLNNLKIVQNANDLQEQVESYCQITCLKKRYKTKVNKKTNNPEWNETFIL